MFSGLRENSILYVLDKTVGKRPVLYEGTVLKKLNPNGFMPLQFGMPETEIAVKVKIGDSEHDIEKLPANQDICYKTDVVVADNKEAMYAAVQAMEKSSQSYLENVAYHTEVTEACPEMYAILNPQIARDKETDARLSKLESAIGGIGDSLSCMQGTLEALNKSINKIKNQ